MLDEQIASCETEADQVIRWRLHVLIEAGYTVADAELLAESEADLHRAVELLGSGCPHELAARILI